MRKNIIKFLLFASRSDILKDLKTINELKHMAENGSKRDIYDKKLTKLLQHSYKHVPYYQKVLKDAGVINSDETINLKNFINIKPLTKKIIYKNFNNLKSVDSEKRKSFVNHSGGSTGEPTKFIQDRKYLSSNIANKLYLKSLSGQKLGDKELRIWASEDEFLKGKEKPSIRLRNFLYNRKEINGFMMSEQNLREYVEAWNKFKPLWVETYAISIYELAKYIDEHNLEIHSPKHGILTTAETLLPEMYELIKKVFKAPIYDRYGSREVGDVAYSVNKSKFEICFWNSLIEVLDENFNPVKKGKIGKVYITTLNNYSMPLIRYDIGDFAKVHTNENLLGFDQPLYLDNIEGRIVNMFKKRDGSLVSGGFFIHFIGSVFNTGFIDKFQVIQKDYDLIEIKIILNNKEEFEQNKNKIEENIRKIMGNDCKIKWTQTDIIPPLKSGKYLYTLCEIK